MTPEKMTETQKAKYLEILKDDRQWLRSQRLQHAKHQLQIANSSEEKDIWKAIIRANSY